MYDITLNPIPAQEITTTLEGIDYNIKIYTLDDNNNMGIDITADGVIQIQGLKIVPNTLLNPYPPKRGGNFIMSTADSELINYENFGTTQHLYYLDYATVNGA